MTNRMSGLTLLALLAALLFLVACSSTEAATST